MKKRGSTRGVVLLVAAGLPLFLGGAPKATWALDLNGIKVTPSVTYKGEYDDNVFRTRFDKRSDYASTISPGITVEATPGRHEVKLGYKADIIRYSRFTTSDADRHTASLLANLNFARFTARLSEEFRRTDDFPSSELQTRIRRNENSLSAGFDFDFVERWGIGFDYTWGHVNYLRGFKATDIDFEFLLDRNTYTYATNLYYRITPKTRVFGEYDFVREIYRFDKSRHNNRHRGLLGIRGDLTEKLSLTAKGGYERLDFHSDAVEDQDNFVTSLEGSYRPSDRLQIALILSRSVEGSTFAGNRQFGSFNATLGITYAFTPKITIIPRGSFGVGDYRESSLNVDPLCPACTGVTEKRIDFNYGGGVSVRYDLQKWIQLGADYDFSRRDSNFNQFDFDDNRVSFSVTLSI